MCHECQLFSVSCQCSSESYISRRTLHQLASSLHVTSPWNSTRYIPIDLAPPGYSKSTSKSKLAKSSQDVQTVVAHRPCGRRGRRLRPRAAARLGGAEGELLREHLPERRGHRARRGAAEDAADHPDHRLHHPPLLPRLLRRGLRRVGADRVDAGQPGGEGRLRQQVPRVRRLRHGAQRQGRRRGRLPEHRLLRRRARPRHPRRDLHEWRALLPDRAGQAGRPELQRQQRGRPAARAEPDHGPAAGGLQGARAQHVEPRRALGGAQRGPGALQQVLEPAVQVPAGAGDGPDAEPHVREVPGEQVPRRRAGQPGAHGPGLAGAARQPVLPEPAGRRRAAGLRRGALHRQPDAPHGGRARQQHHRLLQGLRRRHRQARPRRGQVRQAGQHPQAVRRLQLKAG